MQLSEARHSWFQYGWRINAEHGKDHESVGYEQLRQCRRKYERNRIAATKIEKDQTTDLNPTANQKSVGGMGIGGKIECLQQLQGIPCAFGAGPIGSQMASLPAFF